MTYSKFLTDVERMNTIYELAPVKLANYEALCHRLEQFSEILDKEFEELNDIRDANRSIEDVEELALRIRVELADLLGDIIVYCASEAQRWKIPLSEVLELIMASNFSKLGADGRPIKNPKTDKFEKGPNYWKPEPLIQVLLVGADSMNYATAPSTDSEQNKNLQE